MTSVGFLVGNYTGPSITTDKDVYAKGESVRITGFMGTNGQALANGEAELRLGRLDGTEQSIKVKTGANGEFSYTFKISDETSIGQYRVRLIKDNSSMIKDFRIEPAKVKAIKFVNVPSSSNLSSSITLNVVAVKTDETEFNLTTSNGLQLSTSNGSVNGHVLTGSLGNVTVTARYLGFTTSTSILFNSNTTPTTTPPPPTNTGGTTASVAPSTVEIEDQTPLAGSADEQVQQITDMINALKGKMNNDSLKTLISDTKASFDIMNASRQHQVLGVIANEIVNSSRDQSMTDMHAMAEQIIKQVGSLSDIESRHINVLKSMLDSLMTNSFTIKKDASEADVNKQLELMNQSTETFNKQLLAAKVPMKVQGLLMLEGPISGEISGLLEGIKVAYKYEESLFKPSSIQGFEVKAVTSDDTSVRSQFEVKMTSPTSVELPLGRFDEATTMLGMQTDDGWKKVSYIVKDGQMVFELEESGIIAVMTYKASFNDIEKSWAKSFISKMAAKGLVSGRNQETFDVNGQITRAEFVTMIVNHMGFKDEVVSNFNDVPKSEWYYTAVGQAAIHSITAGQTSGNFRPEDNITREEMAMMLAQAYKAKFGEDLSGRSQPFSDDSKITPAYKQAVYAMRENSIISGYPDNTFKPTNRATRAEAVVMIYNFMNK